MITLLYVCYSKYIRRKPVVKLGGYGILIVMTGSMEPELEEKELILIKESKQYNQYDIVTYVDVYGNLITHRIAQIDDYNFITKGDKNEIIDEITSIHNIQGKIIFHSKFLGIFVLYYLKFVILGYAILLLVMYFIDRERKEDKDEKKEE